MSYRKLQAKYKWNSESVNGSWGNVRNDMLIEGWT